MNADLLNANHRLIRALRATRLALAFLTIIPVRVSEDETTADDIANSRFAYPLVGGLIGLALAALSEMLRRAGAGPTLSAVALLAAGALISGFLHLDGLSDSADGLLLWGSPERRLAAMRDPHVGSFGVTAIVLVLLGKYAALGVLAGPRRSLALVAAMLISRTLILVSAGLSHYARSEGTGRILIEASTLRDALVASIAVTTCGFVLLRIPGLAAAALALLLAFAWTRLAERKIGGITGDTLGALVELGELAVLLTIAGAKG